MHLRLAPEIQERMLCMPKSANPPRISERSLRWVALLDARRQYSTFDAFLRQTTWAKGLDAEADGTGTRSVVSELDSGRRNADASCVYGLQPYSSG